MSKQRRDNQKEVNTKRPKKCLRLIVIIIIIVSLGLLFWFIKQYKTVDEQFAAIEAARAIPKAENAAVIYNELLADSNATSLLDYRPQFFDDQMWDHALKEPWLSTDYPQLDAWIRQHQYILEKIHEATQFEQCRFPIIIDLQQMGPQMERAAAMRQWAFFLSFAANNDLAENRIEAAITKWRCILKMGNHHRQQPDLISHLVAPAVDRIAFVPLARFIVEGDATETYLQKIEAIPLPVTDNWTKIFEETRLVEDMTTQKLKEQFNLFGHVQYNLISWRMRGIMKGPDLDKINELYLRHITTARGIYILIALRRHKNKTGQWPESLEQIKDLVSQDILIDPQNNGPFVYKLTENGLTLYSIGFNNINEGGIDRNGADDSPIWPLP